jgi:DNA-binding XRE family transcriptional regulator
MKGGFQMADVKGQRIKALRRELNMTQDDLAEHLGKTRQAVNSYENEKGNPEIPVLIKLAEVLSCSVDYLLGMSDNRQHAINEEDRAGFDEAMKKHSEEHQKIAFLTFAKILNSTAEYRTSPYLDKPFRRTMLALESISDCNSYTQQVAGQETIPDGEAIEICTVRHAFGCVMIQRVNDLNDMSVASIASHSPKAYALSKRLYGVRDSGLDVEETVEVIKKMKAKKPVRALGKHGNANESHKNT